MSEQDVRKIQLEFQLTPRDTARLVRIFACAHGYDPSIEEGNDGLTWAHRFMEATQEEKYAAYAEFNKEKEAPSVCSQGG